MNCFDRKWVILLAAFFGNFCSIGLVAHMSVLYVEWLEAFGQSAAETSLVQSITVGIYSISGVIFGMLLSRFGVRIVGMVSGTIHALGFILSSFAPNLIYLICVLPILAGFGSSGLYLASMTAVQQYFEGKQGQITLSIVSVGSGVGGTVFTYLLNYLSLQYGWKGCMLIVGGLLINTIPLFAICKPANKQNSVNANTKINKSEDGEKKGRLTKLSRDFKQIIKTKLFLINLLGIIILPAIDAPMIILIDFLQEKGFSRKDAVLSYMIITIFNSISRIAPALLKFIPHMSIFGIALLTSAVGTATLLAMPSVYSFSWNIVAMCCLGFCYGAVMGGIFPLTVSKTVSQQHFSQALGITLTKTGIVIILIGPFHGYLRDTTGSYDAVFYATGSYGCLSILMYIIALGINRIKLNKRKTTFSDDTKLSGKENTFTNSDDRKKSEEENASTNSDDRKQSEEDNISTKSDVRNQFEDKNVSMDHAYENLSFETYL